MMNYEGNNKFEQFFYAFYISRIPVNFIIIHMI